MAKPGRKAEDRRRYEAELPNDLWQADVMHGPEVEHQEGSEELI
ncbi:MAG: hypothetical protein U5J98_00365 [Halobacteriales archaeon]|nr:hypothetical protein [Halobacteriales archaeon]